MKTIGCLCSLALCLLPYPASGQEVSVDNFSGVGARAMGMGGAYIAVADDFSATYWNPAGLAQMKQAELYGAVLRGKVETDALFFGQPSSDEITNTRFGSLGFVFPYPVYRGSLVFAVGFNRTKDFDYRFQIDGYDTKVQYGKSAAVENEGGLGAFSVAVAVDLSPSISVGGAINVWDGDHDFSRRLTLNDTKDAHLDTVRLFERLMLSDEYDGANVKLGGMIRASNILRFGATISSPVVYKVASSGEDEFEDEFEDSTNVYSPASFSGGYKISLPFEFSLGASCSFSGFLLAADIHYAEWEQTDYKELPVFEDEFGWPVEIVRVADLDEDGRPDFERVYKSALGYHLGGEYAVPLLAINIRAGFYRDPIPFVGPRSAGGLRIRNEDERNFLTFGIGMLIEQALQLDFAWVQGSWKQVEPILVDGSQVDKRVDQGKTTRIFASMSYRF